MTQSQAIQLFEEKRVRTAWDTDKGNVWRCFISALLGGGFAALAFYLLNYVL